MLIKKYCANRKLRSLKLHYFGSIGRYLILMNDVFANLETLHLEYVALPYSALQLINVLPQIKSLNVSYCIPNLPILNSFVPIQNLNLQHLILRCRDKFNILEVLRVIHFLYPNIETLRFQMIGSFRPSNKICSAMRNVGLLKSLSTLDFDIEYERIETLINNLTTNKLQLKHLCIRYGTITPYTIDSLTQLDSIEELIITNTISNIRIDIYKLIEKLPKLRLISMIDTDISMQELGAIVYTAKNLVQAEFKMSNNVKNDFILANIKHSIEKRKNKLPLWLTLHVNGHNDVEAFSRYMERNHNSSLLHIRLTHKGVNMLAVPY